METIEDKGSFYVSYINLSLLILPQKITTATKSLLVNF